MTGFGRDPGTQAYYDARAGEYDEWYEGEGKFAARDRPGWDAELANVVSLVAALPAARTLDVPAAPAFSRGEPRLTARRRAWLRPRGWAVQRTVPPLGPCQPRR